MADKLNLSDIRIGLAKNTVFSALTSATDVFVLGLAVLAGRYLGVENFGLYAFALSLTTLYAVLTNFGLDNLMIREVARDKSHAVECFGNILSWKIILSFFTLFLIYITTSLLKSTPTFQLLALLMGIAAILRSFNLTIRSLYRAFERFELETLIVTTERIILFALGTLVLIVFRDVIILAFLFVLTRIVTLSINLRLLRRKLVAIKPQLDYQFIKDFQRTALPFGIIFISFLLYYQIDTIILSVMTSEREVGLYNAGFKIYEGLRFLPLVLSGAVYPRLSSLFLNDKKKHFDLFSRCVKYLFIMSLLTLGCGVLFSDELVRVLFGDKFMEGSIVLKILLFGLLFNFQNTLMSSFLLSIDRQTYRMYISLLGSALRCVLDIVLILYWGIIGVSISVVICEFIVFLALYLFLHRQKYRLPIGIIVPKPLFSVFLITAIAWKFQSVGLIPILSLYIVLYGCLLFLLRVFDKYELNAMYAFITSIAVRPR